ncbi:MAG: fatty acid desaturase [Pseudomonadota bacterium]|jgi:stearoyl-CoA desaturase (delta-9 desaturase)
MSAEAAPGDASVATTPPRIKTDNVIGFVLVHLIAALALLPAFFSWGGVAAFAFGVYVFGALGINLGFHRLLTHRSFSCPLWLEHTLAFFGTCSLQFSPAFWVAVHRRHHHYADDDLDPHSPLRSFIWAHFGWLLARPPDMRSAMMTQRYARDLLRDPFYARLEHRKGWMWVGFLTWIAFFVLGFAGHLVVDRDIDRAIWSGLSLFIWGGPLRTVFVWHTTWAVNSVSHVWGYRNYRTDDDSRNNVIVALLAAGEGWHNNHHADPNSARHGHTWWEFDLTWWNLKLLMALGLATDVKLPSPALADRRT